MCMDFSLIMTQENMQGTRSVPRVMAVEPVIWWSITALLVKHNHDSNTEAYPSPGTNHIRQEN